MKIHVFTEGWMKKTGDFSGCFGVHRHQHGKRMMICLSTALMCFFLYEGELSMVLKSVSVALMKLILI